MSAGFGTWGTVQPPQTGGYDYYGGFNPGSASADWWQGNRWDEAGQPFNWNQAGFDPNNPFGTTMYGMNGQSFAITPEMEQWFQQSMGMQDTRNQWAQQTLNDELLAGHGWMKPGQYESININGQQFAGMDPRGALNFNPGALGLGGEWGGAGSGQGEDWQYGGWEGGPVDVPGAYSESAYQGTAVDPAAAIAAAQPAIQEKMNNAFADAGNRLGQSGFAMSTPYTGEAGLGGAARRAASDMAEIESRYTYDASKFNSAQEQAAYQAQKQREAQGWATHGGWQMGAGLADQANQFNAWNQMGNWQYGWDQSGLDRQMQYDMMNMDQQNMQAQIYANMMGAFI